MPLTRPSWTRTIAKFRGFTLLAGLSAAFLVAAVAVFVLLVNHKQMVETTIQEDALWATYQLDREAHKLLRAATAARNQGSPEAFARLSTRFDIVYSRIDLLRRGAYPHALRESEAYAPGLATVQATITGITPLFDAIAGGTAPDPATLALIETTFEQLLAVTEKLVSAANAELSRIRADSRTYQVRLYQILATLVAALTVSMGGLIVLLVRQVAEVIRSRSRVEAMAVELGAAAEAAEAGARAKTTFLATMSHEIRTPINGVVGMTDILMDTPLTADQTSFVKTIRSCGLTLVELVNDVLDFSKLEAGSFEFDEAPFDPVAEVERAVKIVEPRAKEKGVTVILAPSPALAERYSGDSARLRQIVLNFLSNAVKFTESGTVSVWINPIDGAGATKGLRIEVHDTGIGIPQSARARLFTEFSQVDASITRRFGGTGLGLAICKRIIDRIGGRIGFESEEGEGSIFWMEFPADAIESAVPAPRPLTGLRVRIAARGLLEQSALETLVSFAGGEPVSADADVSMTVGEDPTTGRAHLAFDCRYRGSLGLFGRDEMALVPGLFEHLLAAGQAETADAAPPPPTHVTGLSVLVAEDNRVNQEVARRILERLGHRVTIANNGAEALALAGARDFDLVLMDMQMPVMDGLEASRAIRKSASRIRAMPIVAMTANAFTTDRDACLDAGMNAFLTKPIDRAKLAAVIDDLFGAEGAPPEPAVAVKVVAAEPEAGPGFSEARIADLVRECDADGAAFLLATFLEDAAGLLSDFSAALASDDRDGARRALHTLKGAAANVGHDGIAGLASTLMAGGDWDMGLISRLVLAVSAADGQVRELRARHRLPEVALAA